MDDFDTYERQFDAAETLLGSTSDTGQCRSCCQVLFGLWEAWLAARRDVPDRQSVELRVFVSAAVLLRDSNSPTWAYIWAWLRKTALDADDDRLVTMNVAVFEVIYDEIKFDCINEFQNFHQFVSLLMATSDLPTHQRWRVDHLEAIRPLMNDYLTRLLDIT